MANYFNQYGYFPNSVPNPNNQGYSRPQIKQYVDVNGLDGAKAYQLMPNQSMMLMDNDNPIIYKKTVDPMGNVSLRYFKIEEIDEEGVKSLIQQSSQPTTNYASKDDIDNINKKLDELFKRLDKSSKKEQKDIGNL